MPPDVQVRIFIESTADQLHELADAVGKLAELLGGPQDPPSSVPFRPAVSGGEESEFLARLDRLTTRENEVVEHLVRGMSNRQIARELGISALTVKNHLHAVFMKLEVGDRTQAIARILRARRAGPSGANGVESSASL